MEKYNPSVDMMRHQYDDFVTLLTNFLNQENVSKELPILDLGCGNCSIESHLPDYKFVGFDRDENLQDIPENVEFHVQDLNMFPYNHTDKYDTIICADVMEHLQRPDIFLEYVHDYVLNDNGVLIGSVPNVRCIDDMIYGINSALFNSNLKQVTNGRWCSDHIRFFDFTSLTRLMTEIGYSLEYVGGGNCQVSRLLNNIVMNMHNILQVPVQVATRVVGHSVPEHSPNIFFVLRKVRKVQ